MAEPISRSRLLAAVSVAQLATGVAGMVVALRRRHPYDVFWMHGPADTMARDTILKGTALSAPVSNLLAQTALTAVVARQPSRGAARALGGLGALPRLQRSWAGRSAVSSIRSAYHSSVQLRVCRCASVGD